MRYFVFLCCLYSGLLFAQLDSDTQPSTANWDEPPNILLIVSDDQGYADLSITGFAKDVKTPNLDRLAQMGTRFTNAYATASICSPSRAGLMTGSYQQRFGITWYGGKGIQDGRYVTIAELLSSAGYRTGYMGKFHYGEESIHVPGNRNFPLSHGFDEFYGFANGRKHFLVHNAKADAEFVRLRAEHPAGYGSKSP